MMTVTEEVARAVQIASASPPSIDAEKAANSCAPRAPSISLPLATSSPQETTVTIQRSPAFSLSCQNSSNGEEEESFLKNFSLIGGYCLRLIVSEKWMNVQVIEEQRKWERKS